MPNPEQRSRHPASDSPERVGRSFLAIDPEQVRDIRRQISEHLCDQSVGMQSFPSLGPDRCLPPEICQAGAGVVQPRPAVATSRAAVGTLAACDQGSIR